MPARVIVQHCWEQRIDDPGRDSGVAIERGSHARDLVEPLGAVGPISAVAHGALNIHDAHCTVRLARIEMPWGKSFRTLGGAGSVHWSRAWREVRPDLSRTPRDVAAEPLA